MQLEAKPLNLPITWSQIIGLLPVVSTAILVISSYVAIKTQIALIDQSVRDLKEQQGAFLVVLTKMQERNTEQDVKLENHEWRLSNRTR